jgi:hypothetical protein
LLTDGGVLRVFFRTSLDENAVHFNGPEVDVTAGTLEPEEKQKPEILPAPFSLTDGVVLPDGRALMLFKVAWAAEDAEPAGAVLFVRDGDGWLIDDYIFFHG